ncbi:helix-turn-helix domain-containing protein [Altericroceibacterium endophyticum]|uniref:Helix-turn-helix domain-containing protein n=1 Tax=Altericroceibacterium endophyticum TaxID=1808508 RepID=A0A6I4T4Z7_9SPHN|nr:helix-turn-helix domain-containing protein [Altericroceibacterium endophyticum]MXO65221.1 helix-turn-helix domain-containing protein [Altericroceibacterium endophyticum]
MTGAPTSAPHYALYGEDPLNSGDRAPAFDEFIHCETIASRSSRYDWEISLHSHPNLLQVLFVERGQFEARIGPSSHKLSGPSLIAMPSGTIHAYMFAPDVSGIVATIACDFVEGLPPRDALRQLFARPRLLKPSRQLTESLSIIGAQVLLAGERRDYPSSVAAYHALAEGWLRLATDMGQSADEPGQKQAERFRVLVERDYRTHRPLSAYAEEMGCTQRTLTRQCRLHFGTSPKNVIHQRIIAEARRMLRFTNAGIGEVALDLGFDDPSYFSRFYARMTGRRPSAEKFCTTQGSAARSDHEAIDQIG